MPPMLRLVTYLPRAVAKVDPASAIRTPTPVTITLENHGDLQFIFCKSDHYQRLGTNIHTPNVLWIQHDQFECTCPRPGNSSSSPTGRKLKFRNLVHESSGPSTVLVVRRVTRPAESLVLAACTDTYFHLRFVPSAAVTNENSVS